MKTKIIGAILLITLVPVFTFSQERVLYKQIDTTSLYMDVFRPESVGKGENLPAIVFFFGGGWVGGSTKQFEPHARYFSQRGMVCFLADYRVKSRQQTSPFESLKDAKSAIRFIREHAGEFIVDTSKIVASGGSAGGHLAAATAMISEYNEDSDNMETSCRPNALVLFNPVIDNGPGGAGYERIGEAYKNFSPLHNIHAGAPPTIFFLGTEDKHIPVETAEYYAIVMEKVGARCDLLIYEGESHGFFNYQKFENYRKTLLEADQFLQSIGYLQSEPEIDVE